ncbi:DUF6507 family protein [Streptomyces antarcticus]|uniref:DUF6507 family protein n=1 Tax=Streptomyces antarcticus TaxID=2996458 RepID=UPI002270AAE8|nr:MULTISPECIES: DUF6507 family protein [unclassified Streptomyces]MCY0947255.1 DUF6507 family protein [Streptomyces sp. H34-AA3]MCY0952741.1 DUF6507 family protein [Streptomyces sp. H27-S2]MCY0954401.1 DUF6507 family protein [Streptomyces sp. H27-S2]MCZ4086508.1 DUF6507 family protein [Streptomyces sp. H34-S5]
MTSWDIKPQGVQGHLKTVGGNAGELETALNALLTAMSEAAQAAGTAVPGSQSGMTPQGPLAPGAAPSPGAAFLAPQKAMGPVAAALGEYLTARKPEFKSMAERIEACIRGAVLATNEYLQGDLDQAKEAQDAARSVNLDLLREKTGAKQ